MFQIPVPNILDNLKNGSHKKIKGTVVLMKNNVLDFNDFHASVLDRVHEFLGQGVSLQLIGGDSCEFSIMDYICNTMCLYLVSCIYIYAVFLLFLFFLNCFLNKLAHVNICSNWVARKTRKSSIFGELDRHTRSGNSRRYYIQGYL